MWQYRVVKLNSLVCPGEQMPSVLVNSAYNIPNTEFELYLVSFSTNNFISFHSFMLFTQNSHFNFLPFCLTTFNLCITVIQG